MLVAELPRVLLLDLDDTILHFDAGQPNFWQLAVQLHLPGHEAQAQLVAAIEAEARTFWSAPERAFWGRQNMHAARRLIADTALGALGVDLDVRGRIADQVTDQKEAEVRLIDGAVETLERLRARGHRLALLTNGSSLFQRRKLARFGLEGWFERVLIEGELGYGKPDRRVFGMALADLGVSADEAWMIGDNLEADIGGAQALGITGVWVDSHGTGLPESPPAVPRHRIRRLSELLESSEVGCVGAF
jgi:putative hydrolase of the HAD superfamily